ncbi:MAG: hypothetical protein M1837_004890 [Sclerophora amabilis]|nr:MAG: hypothetical protein M1837_004890 [Sclerophora amabilis]
MALPPIAPFPSLESQRGTMPEEWEACLDAWIDMTQLHLQLPREKFSKSVSEDESLQNYLVSFVHELSRIPQKDKAYESDKWKTLRRHTFFLAHRSLCDAVHVPPSLLQWSFLADCSVVFARSTSLKKMLGSTWARNKLQIEKDLQKLKSSLTQRLESANGDVKELERMFRRLNYLLFTSRNAANFFMVGSDFLDALAIGFQNASVTLQRRIVCATYLGLKALTEGEKPNLSLLFDHLYSLKSLGGGQDKPAPPSSTLLSDLIRDTPLLSHLRDQSRGTDSARAMHLISFLETLNTAPGARPKKLVRRKIDKGKARTDGDLTEDEYGHGAVGEIHVHRMSLISQIQDLFPDLGAGFIAKLLDEFGDNVEQVTAHMLEDSLPSHLKDADHSQELSGTLPPKNTLSPPNLPSALPPSRRNIHENDELDTLSVPTSRLHFGRQNPNLTADALLRDYPPTASSKSAILSALAAFDTDDDERDDTYDASDVGGTIDSAPPTAPDERDADFGGGNEQTLYAAWRMTPEVFGRDAATRRGKARMSLRSETGMTDEAIEGWGIMLGRDPRRLRTLEAKYALQGSVGTGRQQTEVQRTAWRKRGDDSGAEDSEGGERGPGGDGRGRGRGGGGRGSGTGRGRGGGRGGSNVAGPSSEGATQAARQRKESSKGSRANHNRRDQRAKKMARGGFGLGAP